MSMMKEAYAAQLEAAGEPDLSGAVAVLASAWKHTEFAEDMYRAMAWAEVAPLAVVLHTAGCGEVAATVVRAWLDANDAESVAEAIIPATPAELLARFEVEP